jgi:RNase H-fold protein (predicted Holliday junction resolvase)
VEQGLKQQKKKLDRRSGEIDSRAAALILQDFIEEQNINAPISFPEEEGF